MRCVRLSSIEKENWQRISRATNSPQPNSAIWCKPCWNSSRDSFLLRGGLRRQCFNSGNILQKILRQAVPLFQIDRAVIRDPNFSLTIFPDQNLKREINRDTGCGQHYRRPAFGTSENQQPGWTHFQSHLFRFAAVVNQREQSNSLRLQDALELFYCLLNRMIARQIDNSVVCRRCH